MHDNGKDLRRLTDGRTQSYSPRWSPDGTQIAFVAFSGATGQVSTMDADGGNVQRLTNGATWVAAPTWSPDGRKIAFLARQEVIGLYVMDWDGRNIRLLTNAPDPEGHPGLHFGSPVGVDWSPDGTTLLFNVHDAKTAGNIWAIDSDGRNPRNLTEGGLDSCEAWSPDGRKILFAKRGQDPGLYTMEPDGRNRTQVLVPALGLCPRWSPSGQEIIFVMNRDFHIVGAQGENLRRLVELPGDEGRPDWFDASFARAVAAQSKAPTMWGHIREAAPGSANY